MFFEGAEKKFELISRGADFLAEPESYWHKVVEMSGARILSSIQNDACRAYLLSESSLFVWADRLTMITCGETGLVKSAEFLIREIGLDQVEFLSYERKNEYYPHRQRTDFFRDMDALNGLVPGKAYRFGDPDEHHLYLYHLDRDFIPEADDNTLEILMYNLRGPASEIFNCDQTIERVRELTRMDRFFPGFQIDDHLFRPCGYSLNAIDGSDYYTVHVTPEESGSYVSFETNIRLGVPKLDVIRSVVEVFQPSSFDVVFFHPQRELKAFELPPFVQRNYVRESLSCGYELGFSTYGLISEGPRPAVRLGALI